MTSSNISLLYPPERPQDARWAQQFSLIGHRGAAKLAPENTLSSFRRAVELAVDGVEFDLYAHSGELLVIHDDRLERTTNGQGLLVQKSLEELRALDAGDGQQIPLLQEVAATLPAAVAMNLELKGPDTAAPVAAWLAANRPVQPVLVSSFDLRELATFRALDPQCAVAPLFHKRNPAMLDIAHELRACAVNLSTRLASRERLQEIRYAGFGALVYTVNGLRQARRLYGDGATGVFTDRPDRVNRPAVEISPRA